MPRVLRRFLFALVALVAASIVVIIAWRVDVGAHREEVLRNTRVGDHRIGGMTRAEVAAVVESVAAEFATAGIRVSDGDESFTTDARTLGVSVSETSTTDAALAAGRAGSAPRRLVDWVLALVRPREVELRVRVDEAAVYSTIRREDPGPRKEPVEPKIVLEKGTLEAAEGKPGEGIDPAEVIESLPAAAAAGAPYVVEVERGEVPPRWTVEDVEALITRARALVNEPLKVRAGDTERSVPAATARSWLRSEATVDRLRLVVDPEAALATLSDLLEDAGEPAVDARFTVDGSNVRIIPGEVGTECCAEEAAAIVERALLVEGDPHAAIVLPLTKKLPDLTAEKAAGLGVVEPVGSFTTRHPAGQPRVQNIHRIADIVRGQLIRPGGKLSVNDLVGRRTREKGFVPAPVIEEGRFSEDVGGGISQFATTLFNAAFFAGLDFGEYQSHSIYISRYPYGREATLSFPSPDLVIENPTPYGVLVWPTYTSSSITVTLYSTKHIESEQTGQTRSPRGNCTRVTTERTRRWLADGRTEVDRVYATYRPEEGASC